MTCKHCDHWICKEKSVWGQCALMFATKTSEDICKLYNAGAVFEPPAHWNCTRFVERGNNEIQPANNPG